MNFDQIFDNPLEKADTNKYKQVYLVSEGKFTFMLKAFNFPKVNYQEKSYRICRC